MRKRYFWHKMALISLLAMSLYFGWQAYQLNKSLKADDILRPPTHQLHDEYHAVDYGESD
jgi:hypothetical protein